MKPLVVTIDDDVDFNRLLESRLNRLGLDVETTTEPEEFFKKLKDTAPNLCIVDLNLDVRHGAGFQIIQAIRNKLGFNLPLFAMSKRSSREDIAYALELGANEYLLKPLDEVILQSKVYQYLTLANPQKGLSFFAVQESMSKCGFNIQLRVAEISEFGLTLEGDHLLSKRTGVTLRGKVIEEVIGRESLSMSINKSWLDAEREVYGAYCEFDPYDEPLHLQIRKWLLQQNAHVEDVQGETIATDLKAELESELEEEVEQELGALAENKSESETDIETETETETDTDTETDTYTETEEK